jgi:K+-transporting ATPase KdpF subunit
MNPLAWLGLLLVLGFTVYLFVALLRPEDF